jgi:hypothetical protein
MNWGCHLKDIIVYSGRTLQSQNRWFNTNLFSPCVTVCKLKCTPWNSPIVTVICKVYFVYILHVVNIATCYPRYRQIYSWNIPNKKMSRVMTKPTCAGWSISMLVANALRWFFNKKYTVRTPKYCFFTVYQCQRANILDNLLKLSTL